MVRYQYAYMIAFDLHLIIFIGSLRGISFAFTVIPMFLISFFFLATNSVYNQ